MVAASLQNKNKTPNTQGDYTEVTTTEQTYEDLSAYYFRALVYHL